MNRKQKKSRLTPLQKNLLWHGIKALLCLVQLYILSSAAWTTIVAIAESRIENPLSWPFCLLLFAAQVAVFVILWAYYDNNDDRSFDQFCVFEETPNLLRDPAYLLGLGITTVGAGGIFFISLFPLFRLLFPAMHPALSIPLSLLVGIAVAGGISVLRLRRLNYVWSVQKTLRRPNEKRMSPVKRILFAVIFFFSLAFGAVALSLFVPLVLALIITLVLLALKPVIAVLCLLVILLIVCLLRRINDRRKFFKRLHRLRDKGELSFTVHGHPYLSLFFRRVHFSLTVTDVPHPDSRVQTPTTYQVAVANCNRRRLTVVLCENNVFQFMYTFQLRVVGSVGTLAVTSGRILNIPLASFFISHSFEFPPNATEGKRILLVDPAPHYLCMRGFREGELITLDNASELFGYTVYGKNSFLNMLGRS